MNKIMHIKLRRLKVPSVRIDSLFTIILLTLVWMILAGNTFSSDKETYWRIYSGYFPNHEIGFIVICRFFYNAGIPYEIFQIIVYTFFVFVLYFFIRDIHGSLNKTLALYFLYPMVLDGIQVRTTIAIAFILLGMRHLYRKGMKEIIIFAFYVLLASMFHYSAMFYLILCLSYFNFNLKQWRNLLLLISMTLLGIFYAFPDLGNLLIYTDSSKIVGNLSSHARLGVVIPIAIQITLFYIFHRYYRSLVSPSEMQKVQYKINICMLFLLPLYSYTMLFFRLMRPVVLSNNVFVFSKNQVDFKRECPISKVRLAETVAIIALCIYQIIIPGHAWDFIHYNIFFGVRP